MYALAFNSDNTHLSRPNLHRDEGLPVEINPDSIGAINCTNSLASIQTYLDHSRAASTLRAYESDLAHFTAWGGAIPASDVMVAAYIAAHGEVLAVATLKRRIASISQAHAMAGHPSPTGSALVRSTLRGLCRVRGTAQRQAKPLMRDDLFMVLERMGDDIRAKRDRALLLLGFAGGFRRSELVSLDVSHLEPVRQGLIVTIARSKTDQEGQGRKIGIPLGRTRHCPVSAVTDWLTAADINEGPLFRSIAKGGRVSPQRLSGEAVCLAIRERLAAASLNPEGYSGHSLRAGFATSAAQAGASTLKIRQQTGHASDAMLGRYIRDGELFVGNAVGAVL